MYVANLSFTVTEEDLKTLFSEFGEVENVNIVLDRFSKQSRGFGFVEMLNNSEADKAIKALNGSELKGKNIKISQSEPNRRKKNFRKRR
jgi:RNA recognition motif-containing protein